MAGDIEITFGEGWPGPEAGNTVVYARNTDGSQGAAKTSVNTRTGASTPLPKSTTSTKTSTTSTRTPTKTTVPAFDMVDDKLVYNPDNTLGVSNDKNIPINPRYVPVARVQQDFSVPKFETVKVTRTFEEIDADIAAKNLDKYKTTTEGPYVQEDGSVQAGETRYDLVSYLRENPNAEAVNVLRKEGFKDDDIDKAKIEAAKPISQEQFTDEYLKKNYPDKDYTLESLKSRKQMDGESNPVYYKRLAEQDKLLSKVTDAYVDKYGKGALIGTGAARVGEFLFAPARALRPEVTVGDISKEEWVIGGAQVALLVVSPVAGKVLGGVAGQVVSKGVQTAAGGVFAADTARNWDKMNNTERAVSLAFDALIIGTALPKYSTITKGAKNIDQAYTRWTGQPAEAGNFRVDPTPAKNIINAVELRGDPLPATLKAKLNESVTRVQLAGNEALTTGKYAKFIDEVKNMEAYANEIKNPYARQEYLNQIRKIAANPKGSLKLAEEVSKGKQGPVEKVVEKNNKFLDDLNEATKKWDEPKPKKTPSNEAIKMSELDKVEGTYKQPTQREPKNMSLEEKLNQQATSDRMAKLIEKAPRQLREQYYKALEKGGAEREEAIKDMREYLEDKYGKKELENYLESGDWEGSAKKPYEPPESGKGGSSERGGTTTKEKVKTETLTEEEKKSLQKIKEKVKNTLTQEEKEALNRIKQNIEQLKKEQQIKFQESLKIREDLKKAIKEREDLKSKYKEEIKTEKSTKTTTENKPKKEFKLEEKRDLETKLEENLLLETQLQQQLQTSLKNQTALQTKLKELTRLAEQTRIVFNTKLQEQTEIANQTKPDTQTNPKTSTKPEPKPGTKPNPGVKPEPQPQPKPQPKTEPRTEPKPKTVPRVNSGNKVSPPPKPEAEIKNESKKVKVKAGTIVWEQGKLGRGDKQKEVVKVLEPPYDKVETLVGRDPVGYVDTGDTPKETIQAVGGNVKSNVSVPMGVTTAHAKANSREITFTSRAKALTDKAPSLSARLRSISRSERIPGGRSLRITPRTPRLR